jgi:GntR family transcriptional regulator, transcriptional repressor for pyruvate dehydrogenase complex
MTGTALPLLRSRRLVEQTVEALRERIVAGVFGLDGELPPQGALCRELGVSRSVVREAMQHLQSQRLIEVSQGRKPRVLPAGSQPITDGLRLVMERSAASLLHLAEVRLPLESDIAALAAERCSPELIGRLERSNELLAAAPDIPGMVEADIQFHRILAEASGNPLFVFLLDSLAELLRASRQTTIGRGGREPALQGHLAILAAIRTGDAIAARRAMREHVEAALTDLRAELQEGQH